LDDRLRRLRGRGRHRPRYQIGLAAAQRRLELERHYLESGDAFPMAYFDLWEGRVPDWLEVDPMGEFWEGEGEDGLRGDGQENGKGEEISRGDGEVEHGVGAGEPGKRVTASDGDGAGAGREERLLSLRRRAMRSLRSLSSFWKSKRSEDEDGGGLGLGSLRGSGVESEGILGTLRRTLTRESLAGLFGQREKTTELGSGATVSPVSTFSLPSPVVHPAVSDVPGSVSAAIRVATNVPSEEETTPDGPYSNMVADGESWFDDMGGTATRDKGKGVDVPVNLGALAAKHDRLRGRFGELNAPLLGAASEGSDKSLVIVPSNSMDSDRPASCEL
jgi:hypothetical protein